MKLKDMENLPDSDCLEIWWTHHWQGWEAFAPGEMEPFWSCSRHPGEEAFAAAWQAMVDSEGGSDE